MGQGSDRGTQYRSGLYHDNEEQKRLMEASAVAYGNVLKANFRGTGTRITTEIVPKSDYDIAFYYAEDRYQQYLAKPGARMYSSAEPQEISLPPYEQWAPSEWTAELRAKHAPKLPEAFWKEHGPRPRAIIEQPNEPI